MDNEIKGTILVIDDDDGHRNAIQFILEKQEFKVFAAQNGKLGLELLNQHQDIQVIIVDLAMLETSGVDVLMQMKDYLYPIRRIVLTAHGEELYPSQAEDLEVFAYLSKPSTKYSLIFTIKSAFIDLHLEKLKGEIQLQKQTKELGLLTKDFAHWIGNKISLIPNYMNLIRDEVSKLSQSSIEKCDKIYQIVEDILKMKAALLESFRESEPEIVKVTELIDSVIESQDVKDVVIKRDSKLDEPKVRFNRIELTWIIEELITNALTAMASVPKKQINISIIEKVPDRILIKFKDTGCGIKKEDGDKIFRAFYSTKKSIGYGIGLFSTKNILAKYGGTIKLISIRGKGSEFRINLKKEK